MKSRLESYHTRTSIFNSSSSPARIFHVATVAPVKCDPVFVSLVRLPCVGFATLVHTSFAAHCTSDLSYAHAVQCRCQTPERRRASRPWLATKRLFSRLFVRLSPPPSAPTLPSRTSRGELGDTEACGEDLQLLMFVFFLLSSLLITHSFSKYHFVVCAQKVFCSIRPLFALTVSDVTT